MFKLNIKDMAGIVLIMVFMGGVMFGLDYMGVDLSAPIDLPSGLFDGDSPSGDTHPSMSPTGAMSGTIG